MHVFHLFSLGRIPPSFTSSRLLADAKKTGLHLKQSVLPTIRLISVRTLLFNHGLFDKWPVPYYSKLYNESFFLILTQIKTLFQERSLVLVTQPTNLEIG